MKNCSCCGKQLPLTEFRRQKLNPDGLTYACNNCIRVNWKKWYLENREVQKKKVRERKLDLKIEVMEHYGGKCACCGEDQIAFLSIDHINGGGNKHRASLGITGGGVNFYAWLKRNDYPEGFQVLCHNCNQAKGWFGICPHQTQKELEA